MLLVTPTVKRVKGIYPLCCYQGCHNVRFFIMMAKVIHHKDVIALYIQNLKTIIMLSVKFLFYCVYCAFVSFMGKLNTL